MAPPIGGTHPTATSQEISWALHELVVRAAALDVSLAAHLGLSPGDSQALQPVMTSDRQLGPVELGALVGLTSGSASGMVDRLERTGHLRRHRDDHDRRRVILEATDDAQDRAIAALGPLDEALQRLANEFSLEQREVLREFLTRASETFRQYAKTSARSLSEPRSTRPGWSTDDLVESSPDVPPSRGHATDAGIPVHTQEQVEHSPDRGANS